MAGVAVAIGGGTIRDLLLGVTPFSDDQSNLLNLFRISVVMGYSFSETPHPHAQYLFPVR